VSVVSLGCEPYPDLSLLKGKEKQPGEAASYMPQYSRRKPQESAKRMILNLRFLKS
jgi:hypothetical protein